MSAPNRLEQAMAQAVFDESRRPEFVRALLAAVRAFAPVFPRVPA